MVQRAVELAAELFLGGIGPEVEADLRFGGRRLRQEVEAEFSGLGIDPVGGGQCTGADNHTGCAEGVDTQVRLRCGLGGDQRLDGWLRFGCAQRFGDRLVEGPVAGLALDALVGGGSEGDTQAHDGSVVARTVRWWHGRLYGLAPSRCRSE